MKSTVVKRSIILAGHKTSVSLEDAFWEGLKDIAEQSQAAPRAYGRGQCSVHEKQSSCRRAAPMFETGAPTN
jgi:hypothetical protein